MNTAFSTSYVLIGSGRLAGHLQHYFKFLNLPVRFWSRNGAAQFNSESELDPAKRLDATLNGSSHVLFAVKDEAIHSLTQPLHESGKVLVHFSGALQLPGVFAAHPLMTFGPRLEDESWYRKIPFVIDEGLDFSKLLPGLPNPHWSLSANHRPYYHALCSLAANFSYLLWQQIGNEFEKTLGLPRSLTSALLHQVVENSAENKNGGFTGPVARGDWQVVSNHLTALNHEHPELLAAYRNYLSLAQRTGHSIPEDML